MYIVMVYDIHTTRVQRVLKLARCYLTWVQHSVLKADLNQKAFEEFKAELMAIIQKDYGIVNFHITRNENAVKRECFGLKKDKPQWFL